MKYFKYGRTFHLPHSPGVQSDDKVMKDYSCFEGRRVIVTTKMDGENTTGYSDGHVHARSIDSRGGVDRDWVKMFFAENVCFKLPDGWRVCGENLWAEHSIHYDDLESYFYGFSIWDENNKCLSWDDTVMWFNELGIVHVPVLYDGNFDLRELNKIEKSLDFSKTEGYVIRIAESFDYDEFSNSVAKFVRPNHVQTKDHWRYGGNLKKNGLRK